MLIWATSDRGPQTHITCEIIASLQFKLIQKFVDLNVLIHGETRIAQFLFINPWPQIPIHMEGLLTWFSLAKRICLLGYF